MKQTISHYVYLRRALRLARRGYGATSPNPMVGAVLVKQGKIIGQGWHHQAGKPHAEIEALQDAAAKGNDPHGATLYVTLEPCSTHGRTPPCTKAIIKAGVKRVVIGAKDPNPAHSGKAFGILKRAGTEVAWWGERTREPSGRVSKLTAQQKLADDCMRLNEAFNHWIVQRTPFVTVKAAMTLDGKIATPTGESKWITGEKARAYGMHLRQGADAIVAGINTILADDPSLTVRKSAKSKVQGKHRIILDSHARTPLQSKVITDEFRHLTIVVVTKAAPLARIKQLAKRVRVWVAPATQNKIGLRWLLKKLGRENITSLLVEGGGEVNASFLLEGLAQRVAFFYAPKILGGANARKSVAGRSREKPLIQLSAVEWKWLGKDLLLTGRLK